MMQNVSVSEPALRMQGIDKIFPGVRALSNVGIAVDFGTIHAIVGENGAGQIDADEDSQWHLYSHKWHD